MITLTGSWPHREVVKKRGQEYTLLWKESPDFVRLVSHAMAPTCMAITCLPLPTLHPNPGLTAPAILAAGLTLCVYKWPSPSCIHTHSHTHAHTYTYAYTHSHTQIHIRIVAYTHIHMHYTHV